jgi:hypothetical protein
MEPKGSLPRSQESYPPEPDQSSPYHLILYPIFVGET